MKIFLDPYSGCAIVRVLRVRRNTFSVESTDNFKRQLRVCSKEPAAAKWISTSQLAFPFGLAMFFEWRAYKSCRRSDTPTQTWEKSHKAVMPGYTLVQESHKALRLLTKRHTVRRVESSKYHRPHHSKSDSRDVIPS